MYTYFIMTYSFSRNSVGGLSANALRAFCCLLFEHASQSSYIYIYIYIYTHMYIYIYVHRERERDVYTHDMYKLMIILITLAIIHRYLSLLYDYT